MTEPTESPPAASPWPRFRLLMAVMLVLAILAATAAILYLRAAGVPLRFHLLLAMGGGIVLSLLLAGALMGLVFVSNRSGHDDTIL